MHCQIKVFLKTLITTAMDEYFEKMNGYLQLLDTYYDILNNVAVISKENKSCNVNNCDTTERIHKL